MSNAPDDVNSGALATAIALVAFATLAVALTVTALVRDTTKEILVGKDLTQENAIRQLKSDQIGSLTAAPSWSDKAKGLVHVPIEKAMEMVLNDLRANPYALSPGFTPKKEECECAKKEDAEGEESEATEGEATEDKAEGAEEAAEECECADEAASEESEEAEESKDDAAAEETAAAEEKSAPEATEKKAAEKKEAPAPPAPAPQKPAPAPQAAPQAQPAPAPAAAE